MSKHFKTVIQFGKTCVKLSHILIICAAAQRQHHKKKIQEQRRNKVGNRNTFSVIGFHHASKYMKVNFI